MDKADVSTGSSSIGGKAGGKGGIDDRDDEGMIDAPCAPNCPDMNWVTIEGGTFMMGSVEGIGNDNEHPQHEVAVQSFKMSKTEVTVGQYGLCIDAGICDEPDVFGSADSTWGRQDRENHPMTYINWFEAKNFVQWIGARLPSESEWEYAARSGGRDIVYPWGNEDATCERAAIKQDERGNICWNGTTMEGCSKPLGNTVQGLCDMAGNLWEWVEDDWHDSYSGAPSDGQAWIDSPRSDLRVLRGGSWLYLPNTCRSAARINLVPDERDFYYGFRVVLDLK